MAKRRPSSLKRWASSTVAICHVSFGSLPHSGSAPFWSSRRPRDRAPLLGRRRAQPGRAYDKAEKAPPHLWGVGSSPLVGTWRAAPEGQGRRGLGAPATPRDAVRPLPNHLAGWAP